MASSSSDATLQTSLTTHVDVEGWIHFTFEWTIQQWSKRSEVNGQHLESPHFWTSDRNNSSAEWCVLVYPKGMYEAVSDHMSVYLCLRGPIGRKVKATYGFWIVSDNGTHRLIVNWDEHTYAEGGGQAWGSPVALNPEDLCNPQNGYLPGDTLTIVCKGMYKDDENSHVPEDNSYVVNMLLSDRMRCNIVSLLFDDDGNRSTDSVCLSVSGREIHAHKHILEKHSTSVFANKSKIEITDHDYDVIREMVTFMYTGKTYKLYSLTEKLLLAAIQYKVTELQRVCETVLVLKLTIENAIPTLTLADEHSLHSLRTQVTDFISQHCREIVKTDSYKGLFGSHPQLAYEMHTLLMQKLNI